MNINSLKLFWKATTICSLIYSVLNWIFSPFIINSFFTTTTSHLHLIAHDFFQIIIRIGGSLLILLIFCTIMKKQSKEWFYSFYMILLIFGGIILPPVSFLVSGEIKNSFIIQLALLFLIIFLTGKYLRITELKYFSFIWIIIGVLLFTFTTALEFFSSMFPQVSLPIALSRFTSYLQSIFLNIHPLIALICTAYYISKYKEGEKM